MIQQHDFAPGHKEQVLIDSLQKIAKMGLWEMNLETDSVYWSNEVYHIHELPIGAPVPTKEAINYYHPNSKEIIEHAIHKAIHEGIGYDLELQIITAKKNVKWVRAIGIPQTSDNLKIVSVGGLFQDIHFQKVTKEALKEKQRILDLALDGSRIGIWNWDIVKDQVVWSEEMYKVYDISKNQFGGKLDDFSDIVHPDDLERVLLGIESAITEKSRYKIEFRVITQHNEIRIISTTGQVYYDLASDQPINMIGTSVNVTRQRLQEQKIKEYNETLEASIKDLQLANEELSSFTYSVSHDLRAPLRAINGFAQAIKSDNIEKLDEATTHYLSRIESNSEKLGLFIDELLRYSRMERKVHKLVSIDLNLLVQEIISDVFVHSKANFIVHDLPNMEGDKGSIIQLLTNLISNAEKYSSKEEQPTVEIGQQQDDNDGITIYIKDNGVGFNMEFKNKLFKIFQRLHNQTEFPGTGIGLAICAKVVKAHGGFIWADSALGQGTTFFIHFKTNS